MASEGHWEKPLTVDPERLEEQKELLLREYNTLRKLESTQRAPRATPYFCWNSDEYWIVPMTLPSGDSLETSGQRKRPDAKVAWRILDASFEALSDIHANQVIHRAITPDRVFLSEKLRVSFGGFVISRVGGRSTISASARDLEGETEFTSPECRQSIAYATERSDVYSLAASLLAWCGMDLRYPEKDGDLPSGLERVAEFLLDCMCNPEEKRPTAKDALRRLREAASVHSE